MSELSIFIVMHHYKPMERIAFALELTISSLKRIDYLYVLIRTFYFTVSMQYLIVSGSFFKLDSRYCEFYFFGPGRRYSRTNLTSLPGQSPSGYST